MEYKGEVWAKRAQKIGNAFLTQCAAKGVKAPMPLGAVRDMIELAYKQGVQEALQVAREVDGTDD